MKIKRKIATEISPDVFDVITGGRYPEPMVANVFASGSVFHSNGESIGKSKTAGAAIFDLQYLDSVFDSKLPRFVIIIKFDDVSLNKISEKIDDSWALASREVRGQFLMIEFAKSGIGDRGFEARDHEFFEFPRALASSILKENFELRNKYIQLIEHLLINNEFESSRFGKETSSNMQNRELRNAKKRLAIVDKKYNALSKSFGGKVTLLVWRLRRKGKAFFKDLVKFTPHISAISSRF